MITEIKIADYPVWMDYEMPEFEPVEDIEPSLITANCIKCKRDFITTDEGELTHNICAACVQ